MLNMKEDLQHKNIYHPILRVKVTSFVCEMWIWWIVKDYMKTKSSFDSVNIDPCKIKCLIMAVLGK